MQTQTVSAPAARTAPEGPVRVCLVGIGGFGGRHLANIRRLEEEGRVRLVAAVDRRVDDDGVLGPDVPMFGDLAQLEDAGPDVDVVVVSTPIDTHFDLALAALVEETRAAFGQAVLIDCHSMPHEAIEAHTRPGHERPEHGRPGSGWPAAARRARRRGVGAALVRGGPRRRRHGLRHGR